jgi:hypothetical protein
MDKGMFFTLIAIVLSGLFVATFAFTSRYDQSRQMDSVEIRINTMNEFLKSLDNDLQNALYISSYRAFMSIADHISSTGLFLTDLDSQFEQLLRNGTIGNQTSPRMVNQTMTDWSQKMMLLAKSMDTNLSLSLLNVSLSHQSPWQVTVRAAMNVSLRDQRGTASWRSVVTITTSVPIEGFEDPVSVVNSNGQLPKTIVRTNLTEWNLASLQQHFAEKTYRANGSGPSFLMRLEGSLGSSANGIETLVNKTALDDLVEQSASTKDYRIDNITEHCQGCFFLLDEDHVESYGVLGHNYTS